MILFTLFFTGFLGMIYNDLIPVITPSDGTVTGNRIPAYTNTWEMTAVPKNVAPVQQICIVDTDGKQLWWKPEKQK